MSKMLAQGFKMKAKGKELSTLTDVAAYNVAKYADSERYVKSYLNSKFFDTYSEENYSA